MATHAELLTEAQTLHSAALARIAELEAMLVVLTGKVTDQAQEIAALKAEIVRLEAIIAALQPIQYLWKDEFAAAPDDTRYVRAGFDPDNNFVLASPGNLDVVFVTGKVGGPHASGATNKVLRSELIIRVPGTNNHWREDVGEEYLNEFAFTVPTDYAPAVPNETTLIHQFWQDQSVKPPVQFQMLDPATTPEPLTLRIKLTAPAFGAIPAKQEKTVWSMPVTKGKRYDVAFRSHWAANNTGLLVLTIDGVERFRQEAAPTCFDLGQGLAPHLGQYLPGSADDAVGVKTTIRFHHWKIREA
jgi:hypothetical protein